MHKTKKLGKYISVELIYLNLALSILKVYTFHSYYGYLYRKYTLLFLIYLVKYYFVINKGGDLWQI